MTHPLKALLALSLVAGFAAASTVSWAETKSKAKTESAAESKKSQADEFEENRRAHMQKSKENNDKKGAE